MAYFLSGFAQRREDLWVFGSWGGRRYADNAAAFFRYCAARTGGTVEVAWISRDRRIVAALRADGLSAHWIYSPRGMLCCLRAGVYVFDCFSKDINHWLSRGALKANLWSGVPLKTFERDIRQPGSRYYRLFHGSLAERWALSALMPWHATRPDFLISTSAATRDILCRAFDVPRIKVAITGLPRNDAMMEAPVAPGDVLPPAAAAARRDGRKVFLYLPTLRDHGRPFLDIDWAALDAFLAANGAVLMYRFHPMDANSVSYTSESIVELPRAIDIPDVLPHVDCLVSDYSSVVVDYLLLDRPMIYYFPDADGFAATGRSLNFDLDRIAAGPIATSAGALMTAMRGVLDGVEDQPAARQRRQDVAALFHAHQDGRASERLLDAIALRLRNGEALIRIGAAARSRAAGS
ncbi:MAG: CDP-glycerol glycerophosphotransferase family protein [Rhodospirillales bacterium]